MSYLSAMYTYDQENRLLSTAGMTYTYDGNGERVLKSNTSTGAVIKRYWSIGGNTLAEGDGTGNLTAEYIYFGGKRVARIDLPANSVHYYLSDHLGSTSIVASAAGTIEEESDYYPFGTEVVITGGVNELKFTGKRRDTESQLDYFTTRYYSNSLARFTSADSYNIIMAMTKGRDGAEQERILNGYISNPQAWNKYTYVLNDPLKHTDPDGRRELTNDDKKKLKMLKNYAANHRDVAKAVNGAISAIKAAIAAVPQGGKDPAGLGAALYAVGQLGNDNFGKQGSVNFSSNGKTISVGIGDWKCNIFVAQSYALGAGIGLGGSGYPVNGRFDGLGSLWGSVNAVSADTLANSSASVPNFPVTASPGVGAIAAFQAPEGEIGHSAINLGGGALIYAGRDDVKIGTVSQNMEGHTALTYREYKP